jgi:hypothetical protein
MTSSPSYRTLPLPPDASLYNSEGWGGVNGNDNQNSGDSYDSCDLSSSVSVMTDDTNQHSGLIYTYNVRFKTCTEQYLFHEKLIIGEMVTVQCERGYNIGFVDGEALSDPENPPPKRILAKLMDEDNTLKEMLKLKIIAEKSALAQCRLHCKGHRLESFADSIAAEFQFDRKKLTVYLKKYEDVSVCRLVRKLYDTFKIRIKVLEVDDPEAMKELTKKYLDLSKLNVPLSDAFNFDLATSVLSSKKQGKQNKSEKQTPGYSKSHLGKSQHLIPSLAQYGPQAKQRHHQPTYHQHYFTAPTTSRGIGQPQWSDHVSSRDYQQPPHHFQAAQYNHLDSHVYEQTPYRASLTHNFQTGSRNNQRHFLPQPHLSWSFNQSGNWDEMNQPSERQQFDKSAIHAHYHHYNLDHEGCLDEALNRSYHSNPHPPPPSLGNSIFGEHEDPSFSYGPAMQSHGHQTSSSFDLEVLSAALLSCSSLDK